MVKKILFAIICSVLLLLFTTVLAVNVNAQSNILMKVGTRCSTVSPDSRDKCCQDKGFDKYDIDKSNCVFVAIPNQIKQHIKERIRVNVTGLENAIIRVRNNITAIHLHTILNRINERARERIATMTKLEFDINTDGEVVAEGKKYAKFLGFIKVKHKYVCRIMDDGNAKRQKRFLDILWKDIEDNVCGSDIK